MMHMSVINESFPKVWESRAIGRPNGINTTLSIGEVEKQTRQRTVEPIPVASPLPSKVFLLEGGLGHSQMPGYTFLIGNRECRGHGFTAVGAGQAIDRLPNTRFDGANTGIQSARGLLG